MEMIRADRDRLRQRIKRDRAILFQQPTGVGHFGNFLLLRRERIRPTAFAGPKTARERRAGIVEKTDVLTQRMTCAARRTAKNTGGQHGKDELTVGFRIAIENRLPARLVVV